MTTAAGQGASVRLRVGASDLTLDAADAQTLIEAIKIMRTELKRRLWQLERDQPQSLEATVRSIGILTQLAQTFAKPPGGGESPYVLAGDEAELVDEVLSDLRGRQRRKLSNGLTELKRALYRL